MDPWQPCPANHAADNCISSSGKADEVGLALHNQPDNQEQDHSSSGVAALENNSSEQHILSFGDNFQPFVKLPDSQQYLESLEKKLKVIQKGGRKGPNAESILRSLEQTKESCMIKLLSNSVEKLTVDEGDLFEELKVNPLLKRLAPEKQALTAEELVHLLKADQLEILFGNIIDDKQVSATEGEEGEVYSQVQTETPSQGESVAEKETDTTSKEVSPESL